MFRTIHPGYGLFFFAFLSLSPAPRAGDPWKDLAKGGASAEKVLEGLRSGGAGRVRDFLAAGLFSPDRKVRVYCALNLPAEVLREKELKRLFKILLEEWGREDPPPPLPEKLQDRLDDILSSFLEGREVQGLGAVAGWGDEDRILRILAGLEKGKAPWGKPGKKGRKARRALANILFPASDAAAQAKAAAVLADEKRDPRETAPARWISFGALVGGGYPGDRVIQALLDAFLASAKAEASTGAAFLRRVARVYRALPALTRHYRAIPIIRKFLLRFGKARESLLLWAALAYLEKKAPPRQRRAFWKEGARPFTRLLDELKDEPEELFAYFLVLAPALGGAENLDKPSRAALAAARPRLLAALSKVAGSGGLTNELFTRLLSLGDPELLAGVLAAAPARDLDALLQDAEDLLGGLSPEQARIFAESKDPRLSRVGKAALQVLGDDPRAQPDRVLQRLAPIPATDRPGILEEALRRGLVKDFSKLHAWWKAFLEEESPEGARIARAYPEAFRDWLSRIAPKREVFQQALLWCASQGVKEPFSTALPIPVREAFRALPDGEVDPDLPGALGKIATWLTPGDRALLAPSLLAGWAKHPDRLDSGSPSEDFRLLKAFFRGKEDTLAALLAGHLSPKAGQRVAEVCVGGLVRLGKPPSPEILRTLFQGGILPTGFMKLEACGVKPILDLLAKVLLPAGDEGWETFFPLAWNAWRGQGPGPLLPLPPEPEKEWWDLARKGRFTEIYLALLERKTGDQEEAPLATAIRGLALAARTKEEKTRALAALKPFLADPTLGGYWDAVPAAARLGDKKAQGAFGKALAAGRRFFVQGHLLPWIRLERSRKWIAFLYTKGLPASGILGNPYQEALSSLFPGLDPRNFPGREGETWAGWAARRLAAAGGAALEKKVGWDPLLGGWKLP